MNPETLSADLFAMWGGAPVKALGVKDGIGTVAGPGVFFSTEHDPDISDFRDFFQKDTDLGFMDDEDEMRTRLYYAHGLDKTMGKASIGKSRLVKSDAQVWAESQIKISNDYLAMVYDMAEKGALGYSSGAPVHLVEREQVGKAHKITRWPIAEISLTPCPAEPRARVCAVSLKSLMPQLEDSLILLPPGTVKDTLTESGYPPFSPRQNAGGLFPPPPAVRSNAQQGLKHHEETGHGSDMVVGFANRLVGDGLDGDGVKALASHFSRYPHDGSTLDAEGKPTKSYVVHMLRGGDAGKEWAEGCVDSMKTASPAVADTKSISAEERRAVPKENFGDPDNDAYPIRAGEHAQQDLEDAARLIGHAENPEKVKARLITIAHRMKLDLPESWEKEEGEKSIALQCGPDGRLQVPLDHVKAVFSWLSLPTDLIDDLQPAGGSLSGLPLAVHSETVLSACQELASRLEAKSLLDGVKTGRQLSASNRARLQTHVDAAQNLHSGLSQFMDECDKAGEGDAVEDGSPAGMNENRRIQIGEKTLSEAELAAQREGTTFYVQAVLKQYGLGATH